MGEAYVGACLCVGGKGGFRTGGFRTRPYGNVGDKNNPVYVIGHHDKHIQNDMRQMITQIIPCRTHGLPGIIQPHLTVHDLPEQAFPVSAPAEAYQPLNLRSLSFSIRITLWAHDNLATDGGHLFTNGF